MTNNISGLTNNFINQATNNGVPQVELEHGWIRLTAPASTTTNFTSTGGLYFISFNTTNLKFNVVGVGDGGASDVGGSIDGASYELTNVHSEYLGAAGAFYLNVETNIFDMTNATPLPQYFTGPMRGTISVNPPTFSKIAGP